MTASKVGNYIYVNGTGNTLASIASDINDTSFCSYDSATRTLTIEGGTTRYFRIRNGGVLTIGDSTDYSVSETLNFNGTSNYQIRFYVDAGGALYQYGNTTIDMMVGAGIPYYTYIYGKIYIDGNTTYKPVWKNYMRFYFVEGQNNNTYTNDVWYMNNVIIGSSCTANYYAFYFNSMGKVRNHTFKNLTFDKTYGRGMAMYAMRFPYHYNGMRNMTFENINFHNVGNYPIYSGGAGVHLKGITFGTTTSWKCLVYGSYNHNGDVSQGTYGIGVEHRAGQRFMYLEDATFTNNNSQNHLLCQYGGSVLCKDCDWAGTAGDSIQAAYGGVVMLWTGNTFSSGREVYDVDFDGRVQRVHALTVVVKDSNGVAIEDATVSIEQSEGKEGIIFYTNSDGKVKTDHDLECALLTYQHQYGNSKTTNVEDWSNSSNNTYHRVTVSKTGYDTTYTDVIMSTGDQTITITLPDKSVQKDSNGIMMSTDGEMFFNTDKSNDGKKINLIKL